MQRQEGEEERNLFDEWIFAENLFVITMVTQMKKDRQKIKINYFDSYCET